MAIVTRGASPKLIQNLRRFAKPLNSASSSSIAAVAPLSYTEKVDPAIPKPPPATLHSNNGSHVSASSILNLEDVKELFSSVSTSKLIRSSVTLHMAAIEPVVDMGMWVMNSRLMETVVLRQIILETVRRTFYEHFCAGEDLEEVGRTVRKLSDYGLKAMLDYGSEHASDNETCDRNLETFIQTFDSAKSLPPSSVSFVVVKITAICPLGLLMRVGDLLRWEYKNPSFHLPWKVNTLPIFSESSPFYRTLKMPDPLTPEEECDLLLGHQRLLKICQKSLEANIPIVIDAEETSVQPAIDYFTYSAALMYNRDENPIIFGTLQAYLKDAKERLLKTKKAAEKMGVSLGFKLVRGAYMSSEKELASSLGFESPIHNNIQQTHACYNECASYMLEEIANGSGALILATHNIESGKLAAAKARDLRIGKENPNLQFAQLHGMSEALSFGLRNAGFQVSKYLPFGPVDQIMPYLLRRAEENRGLLSTSTLDKILIGKELKRRLKAKIL